MSALLILILVIFFLSNRDDTVISFWPFGYLVALPLGALVLFVLFLGFVLGLLFHAPSRFAAGRRAKRAEARIIELETKAPTTP